MASSWFASWAEIWLASFHERGTTPRTKECAGGACTGVFIRRMETDFKRLLPLLLLVTLPAAVQAQFSYAVTNDTVTITRYIGGGGAVTIPGTINDLPVTSIGDSAFSACTSVTGVTIPTSVTSIGLSAFANCTGLTAITLPGGVTNIGTGAFGFCSSLTAITVASPNVAYSSADGVLFNNTQTAIIEYPPGKAGDYAVPGSVTNIGDYAFYTCAGLTNVTIPISVTNIGTGAFGLCSGLTNVAISEGVVSIGGTAFASCISLSNLTIPSSVANLGDYAFSNCTNLTNAYFLGDAPAAGVAVFSGDSGATVYYWSTNKGWSSVFGGRPAIPWNPVVVSQPPVSLLSCPGSSSSFSVVANGKSPLGYQWRMNGTNLTDTASVFGSTNAQLTLSNLSGMDVAYYDVVITNSGGSTTSSVTALTISPAPAQATPVVVNGFIVGATLTDGGCGYASAPTITFEGQAGTGASGYAQISNGSVTNIVITAAGYGYPAGTTLQLSPPVFPELFIASSQVAMPSGAATPVITNGFVVGANLTAPGAGYVDPPSVSFTDVSGHGAAASAQISNGSITNILITMAGSGYTSNAIINIAAPPVLQAVTISGSNLMAGQNYLLQDTTDFAGWTPVGAPFSPPQVTWPLLTNSWNAVTNTGQMFFRLQLVQ
jgi:hypothetical protein